MPYFPYSIIGIFIIIFDLFAGDVLLLPIGIGLIFYDISYVIFGNEIISAFVSILTMIISTIMLKYIDIKSKSLKSAEVYPYSLIGKTVKVERKNKDGLYYTSIEGDEWKLKCVEELNVGDEVEVVDIDGVSLVVKKKSH